MRSGTGTNSGLPSRVTLSTKARIAFLEAVSFHEGSGSAPAAVHQSAPNNDKLREINKFLVFMMGSLQENAFCRSRSVQFRFRDSDSSLFKGGKGRILDSAEQLLLVLRNASARCGGRFGPCISRCHAGIITMLLNLVFMLALLEQVFSSAFWPADATEFIYQFVAHVDTKLQKNHQAGIVHRRTATLRR